MEAEDGERQTWEEGGEKKTELQGGQVGARPRPTCVLGGSGFLELGVTSWVFGAPHTIWVATGGGGRRLVCRHAMMARVSSLNEDVCSALCINHTQIQSVRQYTNILLERIGMKL